MRHGASHHAADGEPKVLHLLVVLGEGGHTTQCLRLIDLMGTSDYRYSYILVGEDTVSESKISVPGPIHRVPRPGSAKSSFLGQALRLPLCTLWAAAAVARLRPTAYT